MVSTWTTSVALPIALGIGFAVAPLVTSAPNAARWADSDAPSQAQVIHWKSFSVLDKIEPQDQFNGANLFYPPGTDEASLKAKPFHIYDDRFYAIIGDNPNLHLIASSPVDPLFHEAVVWYPPTDTVFFVQNAGAKAAGTGLKKSAIVQKIDLGQVSQATASGERNVSGQVDVKVINSDVPIINPNGGTNWRGQVVFAGEGQGVDVPSSLFLMNAEEPHNASVLLNNYFGRQFNSLNDVSVHPKNPSWIYFTDVDYGVLQDFRGKKQIPRQVYRFNPDTGVVQAVADQTLRPNGLTFSPDGQWLYVSDTGAAEGFTGNDWSLPASIYRFAVKADGTLGAKELFAYAHVGFPDGVHCDTEGNVYSGVGDGIHVWAPDATLLGKIYVGATSANFAFAGKGRMVICAETELWYATLAAEGAHITEL